MKNYKVKAKIVFDDVLEKQHRKIGDEFLCDEERYKFLDGHNAVELIEIVEEKPKKVSKKKKDE